MVNSQAKIQQIYFSPTGTTKRNIDAITKGFGGKICPSINLTPSSNRSISTSQIEGEIVFIGIPIYSGSIPTIILPELNQIQGEGKWAVIVLTYGNVKVGTCLESLAQILQKHGFQILGAALCLGEHSFCCNQVPLGKNRPDSDDLNLNERFGQQLRNKYENNRTPLVLTLADVPPQKPRPSLILLPEVDKSYCTKCMKCVAACPNDAIDPISLSIKDERCILCCACVKICESGARKIQFNATQEKFASFFAYTQQRLEPEYKL